jgi:cytochrome c biogenesis protein CcmG, thiol:disulfide interchange protein DsbE
MTDTAGRTGWDAVMGRIIYYIFVRWFLLPIAILSLLVLSACYRGSRPPRIDTPAPEFTVQDADRSVSLSQLRGQVVVLNFWATWCPPCVEETPSLVSMAARMKDKGVAVVGVSVDVDGGAYKKFIADHRLDYVTVRDVDQKSNALYGTFKFPETYIIDRKGVLRRKFIGAVDWNSKEVSDYLNKIAAQS